MKEFDRIYLSWRKGQGARRYIIGTIRSTITGGYAFEYDTAVVETAKKDGFLPYIEFPDIHKEYGKNVLDIFAQRLIKSERPDIKNFYQFWEVDLKHVDDKFYMLGHTQGLLPTDNFEFLADYKVVKGLHFLTDLAGLSALKLSSTDLAIGDELTVVLEQDNKFDPEAVALMKGDRKVGYVKKIHCRVFSKPGAERLKVKVKAVDRNGIIKRAFVKVYLD